MKEDPLVKVISYLNLSVVVCVITIAGSILALFFVWLGPYQNTKAEVHVQAPTKPVSTETDLWQPPDSTKIEDTPEGDLIRYGRELVAHTSLYLGPRGKVMAISNGLNCQNCHLKAGKKPFGNNYSAVSTTYPKRRARSGKVESIEMRVNGCLERSLNGQKLDEDSREMRAFVAYMKWVGKDVVKGQYPNGAGLVSISELDRPADSLKGKIVFESQCARCHGMNGEGFREGDSPEWKYPPLYSDDSYNIGAGIYRLSSFAAYVKSNMPYGATYDNPILTDEEAWDVAAYINAMPRPYKDLSPDWPDIATKPFDHPFGPYADTFPERQHKFGPFKPIKAAQITN
jgi:thiosulfate dehydrogenase